MITRELFNKFLQDECSDEEREFVSSYLEEHPDALNELLPEDEFINMHLPEKANANRGKRLLEKVSKKTYRLNNRYLFLKRSLVAATILLAAGAGWWFFATDTFDSGAAAITENKQHVNKEPEWHSYVANEKNLHIVLPDSSVVELSPFCSIKYNNAFGLNAKRTVFLSGKAFFKVAKDKIKLFSVYSGDIVTTALGTSFTINAPDSTNVIRVYLHTGKVAVNSTQLAEKKSDLKMYLQPGDELIYYKNTQKAVVKRFERKNFNQTVKNNNANSSTIYKPEWYKFEGQQLSDVLNQLSFYYQVNIEYNNEDIRDNYMTAKFNAEDSLDKILSDIKSLYHLTVIKVNGKYVIKKAAH